MSYQTCFYVTKSPIYVTVFLNSNKISAKEFIWVPDNGFMWRLNFINVPEYEFKWHSRHSSSFNVPASEYIWVTLSRNQTKSNPKQLKAPLHKQGG